MATNAELGRMPGVRVKEILNADLGVTSPQFRIAGLVSTSFTELLKRDIVITRGSEDSDTIPGFEADEIKSVECVSPYQEAYGTQRVKYTKDTDYTVSQNTITWTVAGKAKVVEGTKYYVTATIEKKSASFFEPIEMTDYSQVKAEYGQEYDPSTDTVNPMVSLAKVMFNAGVKRLVCVQAKQDTKDSYTEAIKKLEEVDLQYLLCAGNNTAGVNEALLTHVVDMSTIENSMNRIGFTAPKDNDAEVADIISAANALKSQDMVMVAPGKVLVLVEDGQGNSYQKWVSGIYGAAAIIGMLCNPNRRLATPLTRKDVTAYGILDTATHYKKQDIEKMAENGVTVLIQRKSYNNIVINQGLTTDNTNYGSYYLNVVCCKFEVARLLKEDLDNGWIGTELLSTTLSLLHAHIVSVLDGFKGIYLNDYKGLSVSRDAVVPTKVNVSFKMSSIFALDYIDLSFSVYVD